MFKKVNSAQELQRFDSIWIESWKEKGFELEYSEGKVDKYLIQNEQGNYVGTVEFKPYNEHSIINKVFSFQKIDMIKQNLSQIVEVDKVAILNEHRGKILDSLLSIMAFYAESNGIKFYIALIDPLLHRSLRLGYKIPSEKLAEKMYYKGDYVYPVYINVEFVYKNKEMFSWLKVPIYT